MSPNNENTSKKLDWISRIRLGSKDYLNHLNNKGRLHWVWALVLIVLGLVCEHFLDRHMVWERARYWVYSSVQVLDVRPIRPKRTVVVVIGDDEYWNGELQRRVPIKRDYLAKLVLALDKGEPHIIVLDFAFRSPAPQVGSQDSPEYAEETKQLIAAIKDVSSRRKIVIPSTLKADGPRNIREPSVLDGNNFPAPSVAEGYINLSDDMRELPLTMPLKDGRIVDSLATAVARMADEKAVHEAEAKRGDALPFASFIDPQKFTSLTSTQVLNMDSQTLKSRIGCEIVIVGSIWHKNSYGTGPQADAIPSPAGDIAGVYAHANFIEALLDSRTFRPLAEWHKILVGLVLSILVALVLASPWHVSVRIGVVMLLSGLPLIASYFFRQNLGIFFDFFLPVVMIVAHWVVSRE